MSYVTQVVKAHGGRLSLRMEVESRLLAEILSVNITMAILKALWLSLG
jgi:hypothetical protein